MRPPWIVAATLLAVAAGAVLISSWGLDRKAEERIALGQAVYGANCASCHGTKLEGQPNWRSRGTDNRLPAPPHDETGHTWHHSDEQLLLIIEKGTAAVVGGAYESNMSGFNKILTRSEIEAVLEYIKSTWSRREADYQRKISNR